MQAGRSEWGCNSAYNIMSIHCSQHSSDRKEAALVRPSTISLAPARAATEISIATQQEKEEIG